MTHYRSNTAEKVGIIWTVLSVIASFICGYVFKDYHYNWSLTIYLLIGTLVQAYILYCIYSHMEYQEQMIDEQIKQTKLLEEISNKIEQGNNK